MAQTVRETKLKVGERYMLYGKLPDMRMYLPVDTSKGAFTRRRIYATMFHADSEEKIAKMEVYLVLLKLDNPGGEFEYRPC